MLQIIKKLKKIRNLLILHEKKSKICSVFHREILFRLPQSQALG
jgi:hypothetical protein